MRSALSSSSVSRIRTESSNPIGARAALPEYRKPGFSQRTGAYSQRHSRDDRSASKARGALAYGSEAGINVAHNPVPVVHAAVRTDRCVELGKHLTLQPVVVSLDFVAGSVRRSPTDV
jgi:hypothetical protein